MSENEPFKEKIEMMFDPADLTFFEHLMVGSSSTINIKGKEIYIVSKNLPELIMDSNTRAVILSPVNLFNGRKALDEIIKARLKKEFLFATNIFESEAYVEYISKNINPVFRLGDLDQEGQLKELEVFLLDENKKVNLPKDILATLPLSANFRNVLEHVENKGNIMKFKIRQLK